MFKLSLACFTLVACSSSRPARARAFSIPHGHPTTTASTGTTAALHHPGFPRHHRRGSSVGSGGPLRASAVSGVLEVPLLDLRGGEQDATATAPLLEEAAVIEPPMLEEAAVGTEPISEAAAVMDEPLIISEIETVTAEQPPIVEEAAVTVEPPEIAEEAQHRYESVDDDGTISSSDNDEPSDSSPAPSSTSTSIRQSSLFASALSPASTVLKGAAAVYSRQLLIRPMITKSATAGIIFGLSDWCAQIIERQKQTKSDDDSVAGSRIAFSRIITAIIVGFFYFGPAADIWYSNIFRLLPSTSLVSTLQKALLGQLIFGPIFTCVFFFAGLVESGQFSWGTYITKIRSDLFGVWAAGLGFWPIVDVISYGAVPLEWIPLFVNSASFVWTVYLSLVANRSTDKAVNGA